MLNSIAQPAVLLGLLERGVITQEMLRRWLEDRKEVEPVAGMKPGPTFGSERAVSVVSAS
jgi:hypothetical protein